MNKFIEFGFLEVGGSYQFRDWTIWLHSDGVIEAAGEYTKLFRDVDEAWNWWLVTY